MQDGSLPYVEIIPTPLGEVHVWHMADYAQACKLQGNRAVEKEAINRFLIASGHGENALSYLPSGQPVFTNSEKHLSISHSDGWFAVYIASEPIGIDIQVPNQRLELGKHYFLNEQEQHLTDLGTLHAIWGAKEALYKKYGGDIDDLRGEVTFQSYNVEKQELTLLFSDELHSFTVFNRADYWLVFG
jgi:phosphopantetheinyl transferase